MAKDIYTERLGVMVTPEMGNAIPTGAWWAADNGCFSNPDGFKWDKYQRFLEKSLRVAGDRCLFITTPDVPFDMDGTLARFEMYCSQMHNFGAPVAVVTQDGMGVEDIPWNDVDAIFVGGSTEWKLGHESGAIVEAAGRRRKWVHVGRVNSLRRLQAAASMGANSADGTYLKYGPDINLPKLQRWLSIQQLERPMVLT